MLIQQHLLSAARQQPSPNKNQRPREDDISLIVVHGISLPPGQFGGHYIDQLFCNQLNPKDHAYFQEICQLEVSSHLLIKRDGEIVQYVPFNERAWHAGQSRFGERENCNDFSIGIELEGADDTAYEAVQYQRLSDVCRVLIDHYPGIKHQDGGVGFGKIHGLNITGHSDIAPGRKTDPGPAFDWPHFTKQLLNI